MAKRLSRRRLAAYAMAGVFIALLVLELLAIFSPAFSGVRGARFQVIAYAPRGNAAEAEEIAKAIAERLGGGYRLVPMNTSVQAVALVVVDENTGPLLVLFTSPELAANVNDLSLYASQVADLAVRAAERLPSNTTLMLLGVNETIPLPRNMTMVENMINMLYAHIEAMQANTTTAGNTTG